jgi:SLOG family YspA-like protein
MRVLFCGDRRWVDPEPVREVLRLLVADTRLPKYLTVVHGDGRGLDRLAAREAVLMGCRHEPYPADWRRYRRGAGLRRNQQMVDSGVHFVVAFHDDIALSRGTTDTLRRALRAGYRCYLFSHCDRYPDPTATACQLSLAGGSLVPGPPVDVALTGDPEHPTMASYFDARSALGVPEPTGRSEP